MQHDLIAQGGVGAQTFAAALQNALANKDLDRLDVAVAYATRAGINALRKATGGLSGTTRWVVGLDDAITQPEAIDELRKLPNSTVKLAALLSEGRRFHPKIYCFWSSNNAAVCVCVIGSANMTLHGLNRNGETGVILTAQNEDDAARLKAGWAAMWALGEPSSEARLDSYREFHAKARKAQRRLAKIGAVLPQPEADEVLSVFDGNPATASVAWTEGATPSAGGRDLEFPRKLMPFFGFVDSPRTKRLRMSNGDCFDLIFTMRDDNMMWRLLFSRDSIAAAIGRESLRPINGLSNRSDLAIIFKRADVGADYDVKMVEIGSHEHNYLMEQSTTVSGLERTRNPGGRYFGFF